MSTSIRIGMLLSVSMFSVVFCSCASLKEARFRDNPDFKLNAERFSLNASRMIEPQPLKTLERVYYSLNNPATPDSFSYEVYRQPTGNSPTQIDERVLRIRKFRHTEPQLAEKLVIDSYTERLYYEIWGGEVVDKTTFLEKMSDSPAPNVHEYWIFDGAEEIGRLRVHKAPLTAKHKLVMDVVLHGRSFDLEYENKATWGSHFFAFEYDDKIIALFELKSNGSGEALMSPELANDIKSDIMVAFMLADVVKSEVKAHLKRIGYYM